VNNGKNFPLNSTPKIYFSILLQFALYRDKKVANFPIKGVPEDDGETLHADPCRTCVTHGLGDWV